MCNQDLKLVDEGKNVLKSLERRRQRHVKNGDSNPVKGFFTIHTDWISENKRPFHVYKPRNSFYNSLLQYSGKNEFDDKL